jgi:hypothetical protein
MGLKSKPVGFPKPQIRGKGSFTPPKPNQLDNSCEVGDYVITSLGHIGVLQKWDSNVASVKLDDGRIKEEKC